MALIIDGAQNFGASLDQLRRGPMARLAERYGVKVAEIGDVASGNPTHAYVNHSRLVADCPDCGGAEFVWRDGPHLMMCQSCFNGAIGGKWRRVVMPDRLFEIEAALGARPLPHNRNWQPGETLGTLRAENVDHGIGAVR